MKTASASGISAASSTAELAQTALQARPRLRAPRFWPTSVAQAFAIGKASMIASISSRRPIV